MQIRHRRPPRFGRPRPLQASPGTLPATVWLRRVRPRQAVCELHGRPCRRTRRDASPEEDDLQAASGQALSFPVQLRGSSRLGDGSLAVQCDRSCVVTSRAHFAFDRRGAAAAIALFGVGFLAACGGGNGSAGGTLTSGGTRTTPTRSTPTVTAPTRSTATVTESQTTTVVAVTPPPATTTTTGATTTSGGVSPAAAAAAAAAAASQDDESSSTQWGWIAFGILAGAVLIGGIVWWWRRRSANANTKTPGPGDPPEGPSSAPPD
jgi:cell division septation protein DedD